MPRRLAMSCSKLTRERYAAIVTEMRAAANIPDAAERLAAAMVEAAGEMRRPTGYITLVFSIVKVVANTVVEFLANCAGRKGMPGCLVAVVVASRMVERQASATGNGGGQVKLVESQASAVDNGGALLLTCLEAVEAEHHAAWQQI